MLEGEVTISVVGGFSTCLLSPQYLGSTPIILDGMGAMKSARMFQAQQAVQLIKVQWKTVLPFPSLSHMVMQFLLTVQDPESESRPHFSVKLKVSTEAIRISDSSTDVSLNSGKVQS